MGDNMVSDASIQVLAERVSAAMDDIKEMKGKVDAMHIVNSRVAAVERDVISVDRKAEVALSKTDTISKAIAELRRDEIEPLKIDASAARKSWRVWGAVSTIGFGALGVIYSQWHPWMDDINKARKERDDSLGHYQADVGAEMRRTDNRLTVLEFRANNTDSKGSK